MVIIATLLALLTASVALRPRRGHSDEEDILAIHRRVFCLEVSPAERCPPTYVTPTRTWLQHRGTRLWLRVTGTSLLSLRALSLASGAVCLASLYLLTRSLAGPRGALVALLLGATSPPLIHFWTTGDEYAPYLAALALTLWRLHALLTGRRRADRVAVAVAAAAAALWIYPSVLLFAPLALSFGRDGDRDERRFGALCAALCAALCLLYLADYGRIDDDWQIEHFERWHGLFYSRIFEEVGAMIGELGALGRAVAVAVVVAVVKGLRDYRGLITGGDRFEARVARATLAVPALLLALDAVAPANDAHLMVNTILVVYVALARAATAGDARRAAAAPAALVISVQAALAPFSI